ncbi:MAG: hypothetical protein QME05_02390 [Candidatus Margulisbacteria bacterium]|nr:hypothetical protein [Candidatus Margulisiibacteriota bacterium]
MQTTKEFNKLFLEFFSRSAIVVFGIGIVTPYVAGKLTFSLAIVSVVIITTFMLCAALIASKIRNGKEE